MILQQLLKRDGENSFEAFMLKVEQVASCIEREIKNVIYLNKETALIIYDDDIQTSDSMIIQKKFQRNFETNEKFMSKIRDEINTSLAESDLDRRFLNMSFINDIFVNDIAVIAFSQKALTKVIISVP